MFMILFLFQRLSLLLLCVGHFYLCGQEGKNNKHRLKKKLNILRKQVLRVEQSRCHTRRDCHLSIIAKIVGEATRAMRVKSQRAEWCGFLFLSLLRLLSYFFFCFLFSLQIFPILSSFYSSSNFYSFFDRFSSFFLSFVLWTVKW